jgi:hypothetical protein
MKKLISALFMSACLVGFQSTANAVDVSFSIGAASTQGGYHAVGTETMKGKGEHNTVAMEEEAGVFEDSHQSVFGELNIGDNMTFGVEFAMGDIQTPENTAVKTDKTTAGTSQVTNTAKASFSDLTTVYIQARMLGGLYTKIMYHNVNVISEESLGSGGSYGDQEIEGLGLGMGYQHDLDVMGGMFVRAEITASAFEDVKSVNTTDVDKVIKVTDMYGAQGSIKIGKTF